jgi:hypothetical protein
MSGLEQSLIEQFEYHPEKSTEQPKSLLISKNTEYNAVT